MVDKHDNEKSGSNYSRRQFLINAAKLAGAVAAYPLLSSPVAAAASAPGTVGKSTDTQGASGAVAIRKVGLLLPHSSYYTDLVPSFLAGMSLYIGQSALQGVTLVPEDIGTGGQNVQQKLDTMLRTNQIDMMVGLVNPSIAASIRPTLEAANIPLLASSTGANVPRTNDYSSNIYYHTLGLWQANWALGQWAAANLGTSALMAASSFDSGYDAVYAFRAGYESAGGHVTASLITHSPGDTSGFAPLMAAIRENRPTFVFAGYYGRLAVDFLNAYADAGLPGSTPLVGTAYLTEQQVLQETSRATGVKTVFSWSPASDTPENLAFAQGYRNKTGSNPNGFALLGYEAAQIIERAAMLAGANKWSLKDAFGAVQFTGPRGPIGMSNHSTTGPLYLQEVSLYGKSAQNIVISQLKSAAEQDTVIADLRSGTKTGWLNTYLCE